MLLVALSMLPLACESQLTLRQARAAWVLRAACAYLAV